MSGGSLCVVGPGHLLELAEQGAKIAAAHMQRLAIAIDAGDSLDAQPVGLVLIERAVDHLMTDAVVV